MTICSLCIYTHTHHGSIWLYSVTNETLFFRFWRLLLPSNFYCQMYKILHISEILYDPSVWWNKMRLLRVRHAQMRFAFYVSNETNFESTQIFMFCIVKYQNYNKNVKKASNNFMANINLLRKKYWNQQTRWNRENDKSRFIAVEEGCNSQPTEKHLSNETITTHK